MIKICTCKFKILNYIIYCNKIITIEMNDGFCQFSGI